MGKLFGLSIFINFFVVGIFFGNSRRPLTFGLVCKTLAYFLVVYLCMGGVVAFDAEFLRPK